MASGKGANIAKWTISLLFVRFPSFRQLSAAGNPESPTGPGNGFRKRREHYEMDYFAAFVGFPSFRQLPAAGNPENPRGSGNGFRKRSEHWKWTILLLLWGPFHVGPSAAGYSENPGGPGNGFRKRSEQRNEPFCMGCPSDRPVRPGSHGWGPRPRPGEPGALDAP